MNNTISLIIPWSLAALLAGLLIPLAILFFKKNRREQMKENSRDHALDAQAQTINFLFTYTKALEGQGHEKDLDARQLARTVDSLKQDLDLYSKDLRLLDEENRRLERDLADAKASAKESKGKASEETLRLKENIRELTATIEALKKEPPKKPSADDSKQIIEQYERQLREKSQEFSEMKQHLEEEQRAMLQTRRSINEIIENLLKTKGATSPDLLKDRISQAIRDMEKILECED